MPTETYNSETVKSHVEVLNEVEAIKQYNTYWKVFGQYAEDNAARITADFNHRDLSRLEATLESPRTTRIGRHEIRREDIAEEWYLKLGTFNHLKGAEKPLLTAFVRLWEGSTRNNNFSHPSQLESTFEQAAREIYSTKKDGVPSEIINSMIDSPERASRAVLAGNVMLDFVRIVPPAEREENTKKYLLLTERLSSEMVARLSEQATLTPDKMRILSDALKAKHEARYEILVTAWKRGEITEEQYKNQYNHFLARQIEETLKLNTKISNGDLHEHYFLTLLKYGTNAWQDENRFLVQAATRRQDEPHDGFGRTSTAFSFDAVVKDLDQEMPDRFVQLKIPGAVQRDYAEGITVMNDLLIRGDYKQNHREIMEGMKQMRGLLHELITGRVYSGQTQLVQDHLRLANDRLNLPTTY
jgi:hypothetical protein